MLKIQLNAPVKVRDDCRPPIWKIHVEPSIDFCLGLFLIKDGFCDHVEISDCNGLCIKLFCSKLVSRGQRGALVRCKNQVWELSLSQTEIGYWSSFLARYVIDGTSSVDHIDLEVKKASSFSGSIDCEIILMVEKINPPMSAEEARMRFDI